MCSKGGERISRFREGHSKGGERISRRALERGGAHFEKGTRKGIGAVLEDVGLASRALAVFFTGFFQRVVLFEQKRKVKLFGSKGFALSTVEVRALLSD